MITGSFPGPKPQTLGTSLRRGGSTVTIADPHPVNDASRVDILGKREREIKSKTRLKLGASCTPLVLAEFGR